MKLYSLGGDIHCDLCREEFGLSRLYRVAVLVLLGVGCPVYEELSRLALCGHIGKLELSVLLLCDRASELLTLLDIGDCPLKSALCNTECLCGDTDTSAVQGVHCDREALSACTQEVLCRDMAVLEDQLVSGGSSDTHLVLLRTEGEAGGVLLYYEG